jgi:hypothetical protein
MDDAGHALDRWFDDDVAKAPKMVALALGGAAVARG